MTDVSKRLASVIQSGLQKTGIIPKKTPHGILVGSVLIVSRDNLKDLYKNNDLIYKDISLNKAAITMANLMAMNKDHGLVEKIYSMDQDYGKAFTDSNLLRWQYEKAIKSKDYDRSDVLWARYRRSRDRALHAKNLIDKLIDS